MDVAQSDCFVLNPKQNECPFFGAAFTANDVSFDLCVFVSLGNMTLFVQHVALCQTRVLVQKKHLHEKIQIV